MKPYKPTLLVVCLILLFCSSEGTQENSVGLALSGGGARGLAHIGVLKVFDEIGLKPDFIAGTSIGAIIGGLYATGLTASEIEVIFKESLEINPMYTDYISRRDYYIGEKRWGNYANIFFQIDDNYKLILPQGLIPGNYVINNIFKHTYPYSDVDDFDQLPIPFAAIATDLETGKTKIIRSGSLPEAIRASMSIPSIFAPFEYNGELLIDGGIKMNLPEPVVKEMGADYVIGVLVASELKDRSNLGNIPTILEQTLNISSRESRHQATLNCPLVIEPEIDEFYSYDFQRIDGLIKAGEEAARKKMPELLALKSSKSESTHISPSIPLPDSIKIQRIEIIGNQNLSSAKIREYINLDITQLLTKEEIITGIKRANNSLLFREIYPVLREDADGHILQVKVRERPLKRLGTNIRYTENNDVILTSILQARNTLGNNSTLLAGVSIGGEKELFVDYVKNFGREWGVYFHIFPYANEHTIFFYNDDLDKIASSNASEFGATLGVGGFGFNRYIVETYLYSFKKRLYRNISESDIDQSFSSSGIGIKLYGESLDDLMFPMSGKQALIKLTHSDEAFFSDYSYTKVFGRFQALTPIASNLSIRTQFEYGSYFDENTGSFDPFYLGGFDSFLGMRRYEKSAPIVKSATIAARIQATDNIFIDLQANGALIGKFDIWVADDALYGGGVKVGFKTFLGAIRGGLGVNKKGAITTYLSIGYDLDAFEFSRR